METISNDFHTDSHYATHAFLDDVFDTTMSGNYSNQALAGVAIGSSFWAPVNAAFSGLLMAITPIIAQLIGAKKEKQVKNTVHNGLYIALFLAFILILINF